MEKVCREAKRGKTWRFDCGSRGSMYCYVRGIHTKMVSDDTQVCNAFFPFTVRTKKINFLNTTNTNDLEEEQNAELLYGTRKLKSNNGSNKTI